MIKKAQGLMNDAELQALVEKYDIYLVNYAYEGETLIDYEPDRKMKLEIGGKTHTNLEFYTIDPVDYNLLMKIASNIKNKLTLYVIVRFQQDFTIQDYAVEAIIPPPTTVLRKYNINTRRGKPQKIIKKKRELAEVSNFTLDIDSVENALDGVLNEVTKTLNQLELPIKPLTLESYMEPNAALFTLSYNTDMITDKYTKEQNVIFPPDFTEGFQKYFTENATRRVLRKIRKIINRAGDRQVTKLEEINFNYIEGYLDYNLAAEEVLEEFSIELVGIKELLNELTTNALPPVVFENMKNYILSGMENYYQTKGLTRPLTLERLTALGISREVNSLIRTSVTSSLPGYQTSQGTHRGYTFNKSLQIDPNSPLSLIEAVIRNDPKAHEIIGLTSNKLLPNQAIPPSYLYQLERGGVGVMTELLKLKVNNDFEISLRPNGDYLIEDLRNQYGYFTVNAEELREALLNNPDDTLEEKIKRVPFRVGSRYFEKMINNTLSNELKVSPLENISVARTLSKNEFLVPLRIPSERSASEEFNLTFKFIYEEELGYVTKLTLESVQGAVYRKRALNRKFEIDINAEYGFEIEIRRVINRILNAQDFYSADRSDINITDKSAAYMMNAVRMLSNASHTITIDPPKFDTLTGATRGLWIIGSGSEGFTYLTIDDSKAGASSNIRDTTYLGSACMGETYLKRLRSEELAESYEPDSVFEYKNEFYALVVKSSNCINLTFPGGVATAEDVAAQIAKVVGQEINKKRVDKRTGINLDPMGSIATAAYLQGSDMGKPAIGGTPILEAGSQVHMPVFMGDRVSITRDYLQIDLKHNTVSRRNEQHMDPKDPLFDKDETAKFSDVKPLVKALSGYKLEEIKKVIDPSAERTYDVTLNTFAKIMKILGMTYEEETVPYSVKFRIVKSIEEMVVNNITILTSLEEMRPILEANRDRVKEYIFTESKLGADYGGESSHPSQAEDFIADNINQITRRVKFNREIR